MIILGLDPGIARTGFGVINTQQTNWFVQCGCLATPASDNLADRLSRLGQDLEQVVKKYHPNQAVVEDIFFGANRKTAMSTAHARGALLFILRSHHIPVVTLTPPQIKSRLVGHGHATKLQIQMIVMRRLNLTTVPQPDDAADALAAALCCADHL